MGTICGNDKSPDSWVNLDALLVNGLCLTIVYGEICMNVSHIPLRTVFAKMDQTFAASHDLKTGFLIICWKGRPSIFHIWTPAQQQPEHLLAG